MIGLFRRHIDCTVFLLLFSALVVTGLRLGLVVDIHVVVDTNATAAYTVYRGMHRDVFADPVLSLIHI